MPPERTSKEDINLIQLKRFARHGGPSLDYLRAYPEPETAAPPNQIINSSLSGSRKRAKTGRDSYISSKPRRSSAYDPNFEQHLIDNGIYPDGYGDIKDLQEPHNLEEINKRLTLPRASLSPSRFTRECFLDFKKKNQKALTESDVISKVLPIITGTADIPSQESLSFRNLKDLTDGSITKAKPDSYNGSYPAEIKKHIREELGPYIIPSTNTAAPCLANFFMEAKGPDGSPNVGKRQALHDSVVGARGVHELRSYVDQETLFDNNAYTLTSTYHSATGDLTIYSTHPTLSNDSQHLIEYHMTQLRGWKMTDIPNTFREGACALRNARDWAKEEREKLLTAANGKLADGEHSNLVSSTDSFVSLWNEPKQPESETSADELVLGIDTFASSSHRTPVGARPKPPPKAPSTRRSNKVSQGNKRYSRRPGTERAKEIHMEPEDTLSI